MMLLTAPPIAGLLPAPKPFDTEAFKSAMEQIFPDDGGFWSEVFSAFADCDRVEELIEQTIRKHPHRAPELWDSFMLLSDPHQIGRLSARACAQHRRELINRVVYDQPLSLPTSVELAILALGEMRQNETIEVLPSLDEAVTIVNIQPPYKLAEIYRRIGHLERPTPNPDRWFTRVPLHRKKAILGDTRYPDWLLADEPMGVRDAQVA